MNANISTAVIQKLSEKIPCILVVEDCEDNRRIIAYVIELLNCTLITAVNGAKALEIARKYQPDLILLDIILPDISGINLVITLKQDKITSKIPVIAVTGLALAEEREHIFKAGCDDYISKPYRLEDLEAIIQRHLARQVCSTELRLELQLETPSVEVQK